MKKKLRIGAVNWEAGLPQDTYFGHYMIRTLSNPFHIRRLPYFTKQDESGNYYFPMRDAEQYERELAYAADAGIDFFMHCWYPDGAKPQTIGRDEYPYLTEHLPELNRMRKLHQTSPLNRRIKLCAILIGGHAYAEADFEALIDAMGQEYYEKKGDRPLVFLFGGFKPTYIEILRKMANDKGLDPFIAFMGGKPKEGVDYSIADAVSNYAGSPYFELQKRNNEAMKAFGLPVIPLFSAGWNPQPRIDRPSPWITYEEKTYPPAFSGKEMEQAAAEFFDQIEKDADYNTGYAAIFAWNEFEEGGYLCPTLGECGAPNTEILEGFAKAIRK